MHLSRNHLTHSLSTAICDMVHRPGPREPGKRSLVVVIVTALFIWLLHGDMLLIYGPYNMSDIPSGLELLLYPFLFIRAVRATKIFVLEFSKDGSRDLLDKFADGSPANQPVSLQGGVGISCGQVSQHYCQFQSNF